MALSQAQLAALRPPAYQPRSGARIQTGARLRGPALLGYSDITPEDEVLFGLPGLVAYISPTKAALHADGSASLQDRMSGERFTAPSGVTLGTIAGRPALSFAGTADPLAASVLRPTSPAADPVVVTPRTWTLYAVVETGQTPPIRRRSMKDCPDMTDRATPDARIKSLYV